MGYRGRLINRFTARLGVLDAEATGADPDTEGPATSGYDDVFRVPVLVSTEAAPTTGEVRRLELEQDLPCQVEDDTWEALQMMRSGDSPRTQVTIVFHFRDLEEREVVDERGEATCPKKGDRLVGIYQADGETLVQAMPEGDEALYCTQVAPRSFGLSGGKRNLLVCTFERRDTSQRG